MVSCLESHETRKTAGEAFVKECLLAPSKTEFPTEPLLRLARRAGYGPGVTLRIHERGKVRHRIHHAETITAHVLAGYMSIRLLSAGEYLQIRSKDSTWVTVLEHSALYPMLSALELWVRNHFHEKVRR